jgi:hypothetical protein
MNTYIIRFTWPNDMRIHVINFICDDYKEAEERFEAANPNAILVNIEEVNGPLHETNH